MSVDPQEAPTLGLVTLLVDEHQNDANTGTLQTLRCCSQRVEAVDPVGGEQLLARHVSQALLC